MNLKMNLMWMGAGIFVGSMYQTHKKDVNKIMNSLSNKATRKMTKMVDKM